MGGITLRKKWRILFLKELDTQSFKSAEKLDADYNRAKELYFTNFANHMTMKKNGEFKEYCKFGIPKDIEHEWSLEVKEQLIKEISSESNFLKVTQLACVNLPENEILTAFMELSTLSQKDKIFTTIKQLQPLFEPDLYPKIIQQFENQEDNQGTDDLGKK